MILLDMTIKCSSRPIAPLTAWHMALIILRNDAPFMIFSRLPDELVPRCRLLALFSRGLHLFFEGLALEFCDGLGFFLKILREVVEG